MDFGADGPATLNAKVLSLVVNGGNDADSGLLTTGLHHILLGLETYNGQTLIVGRVDVNGDGHVTTSDPAAFAIALGQDGNVSVAQYLSLSNPTPGSTDAAHDEPATGLKNILVSVTATDGDQDVATRTIDISGNIVFQDDGPTLTVTVNPAAVIVIDETPGVDSDSNDTTLPAVSNFFNGVANIGHDSEMGSPQFATGSSATVSIAANFGADGLLEGDPNSAIVYSLTTTNNINSGLTTTQGKEIFLFSEGGIIVGRFDLDGNGTFDTAAFAFRIDSAQRRRVRRAVCVAASAGHSEQRRRHLS